MDPKPTPPASGSLRPPAGSSLRPPSADSSPRWTALSSGGASQSLPPTVIHLPARRTMVPWLVGLAVVALVVVLRQTFSLALVAFAIAYAVQPLVRRAERVRIPRPITILVVMVGATALMAAVAAVLIPEILRQTETFVRSIPRYSQAIQRDWIPWLRTHWHIRIPARTDLALAQLGLRASEIAPRIGSLIDDTLSYTIAVLELLFKGLIIFALTFYFLLDFDGVISGVFDLVPHRARDRVAGIAREIDDALGHFIRAQLVVMAVLGVMFAVGLGILRVPAWWAIGIFAGMISFVPYLGFFVALALAVLMALLEGRGGTHVLAVIGVMGIVHALDLTLVTPRILGGRTHISPVIVILALVAGGSLFGFLGVLLAIPTASVLRVLLRELVGVYKNSRFYQQRTGIAAIASAPVPVAAAGAVITVMDGGTAIGLVTTEPAATAATTEPAAERTATERTATENPPAGETNTSLPLGDSARGSNTQ